MRETKTEAKTIQDAVEKGLAELGLRRDQVEVTVVSEGTTGFLGFGAKKACVVLREKRWADGHGGEEQGRGGGRGRDRGGRGGRGGRSGERGGRGGGRGGERSSSAPSSSSQPRRPGRYGYEDARLPPAGQPGESAHEGHHEHHHDHHRSDRGERGGRNERGGRHDRNADRVYNEEGLAAQYSAIEHAQDPVEHAKTALVKILALMGFEATIAEARLEEGDNLLFIRFDCADSATFTAENGRALQSLQFVLNSIVNRKREAHLALRLDTGGYWDSKEKELAKLVEEAVTSVKNGGAPFKLEPMPASMRKMVHNLVKASHPGIETSSEGEGRWRKVVIRAADGAPQQQAAAPAPVAVAEPVAAPAPAAVAAPEAAPAPAQQAAPAAQPEVEQQPAEPK